VICLSDSVFPLTIVPCGVRRETTCVVLLVLVGTQNLSSGEKLLVKWSGMVCPAAPFHIMIAKFTNTHGRTRETDRPCSAGQGLFFV
jgi:hypothetical protein